MSRTKLGRFGIAIAMGWSLLGTGVAHAEQVDILSNKDATIYSDTLLASNGSGEYIFTGSSGLFLRRALLSFNVAGSVPPGSTITAVSLTLFVSRSQALGLTFTIHRLTRNWGEGASNPAGEEGGGTTTVVTGDSTWNHTFFPNLFWSNPGAVGNFIVSSSASATVPAQQVDPVGGFPGYFVGLSGSLTPRVNALMVSDVQGWLDNPATNFGWLIDGSTGAAGSAKRFDSRTNPTGNTNPMLTVTYMPEPAANALALAAFASLAGLRVVRFNGRR